ncbi:small RNA 2'-O-methyltransferase [Spea bombifrons]|uniref:small RNA 2'-O-methyltransferase n=1 Tax=Spea bombifrons TaxID=233779 RepID=UPI00234A8DD2|nr:small RNA 2'-O-methyltransferase [Spea bombifrons]
MKPIIFNPSLHQQRHQFVISLVDTYQPKKVADLGCNRCSLLQRLRFNECIEELVGLDINENLLACKKNRLQPLIIHYIEPIKNPLTVSLYHGSVTEKDPALLGFDLISCIELIEHLEKDDLEKFKDTLFGYMAPLRVVISTPNSEFNFLFPNLVGFRHADHKFEWTREEFQNWATDVSSCYNYSVEFSGVGEPPAYAGDVGFCSQIGLFTRNYVESDEELMKKREYKSVYKTVFRVDYPSLKDEKYLRNEVLKKALSEANRLKRQLLQRLFPKDEEEEEEEAAKLTENEQTSQRLSDTFSYLEPESQIEEDKDLEPFLEGNTIHVPIERLIRVPKVKELCGSLDVLKTMISEDNSVGCDGISVLYDVDLENDYDIIGTPYHLSL